MTDKDKPDLDQTKDLMQKVQAQNGSISTDLMSLLKDVSSDFLPATSDTDRHIPVHTLEQIKKKLGETVKTKDEDGKEITKPLYTEEEKVRVVFGLLSEKGLNLIDTLERTLAEQGYDSFLVGNINETLEKTTMVLRDISEMQYRKAKLENERINLEIQKYKADLKKREIDLKEKKIDKGIANTQVIAVGNPAELLAIMQGQKGGEDIVQAQVVEEEEPKKDE